MKAMLLYACCIPAGLIVGAGVVQAQDAAPPAERSGLSEIVVTAQKRVQLLQDVPVSVTALNSETLTNENMVRVVDIQRTTPGLTFANNAASQFTFLVNIRGQQTIDAQVMLDASVGVYLDGVYLPTLRGFGGDQLLDVARVEVLKGPQGTLYGRNTTGGAISIVTNEPTAELEGMVRGEVGNFGTFRTSGVLNIPISEGWAVRLTGQYGESDGWAKDLSFDNKVTQASSYTLRGTLKGELSDRVTMYVRGDWSEGKGGGFAWLPMRLTPCQTPATGGACTAAAFRPFPAALEYALEQGLLNPADLANPAAAAAALNAAAARYNSLPNATTKARNLDPTLSVDQYEDYKSGGASLDLNVDVGDTDSLKYIGSYRYFNLKNAQDLDGIPGVFFTGFKRPSAHDQVTQELQYNGQAFSERLQYVAGLYYYWFKAADDVDTFAVPLINPTNPGLLRVNVKKESYAAYTQGSYEIFDDAHITAGLRYTKEKRHLQSSSSDAFGCNVPPADAGPNCDANYKRSEDNWSWKIGADYRVSPALFFYGNISRGYKSGGFNQYVSRTPSSSNAFDPEVATQYEIGFKSDLLDRILRFNAAAYITDVEGLQRSVIANANSPQTIYQNAADSQIKGFEVETQLSPVAGLNLSATVAYTDAEYKNYVTADGVDHSSQPFQQIPEWTYSLTANYEVPTSFGSVTGNMSWSWRSKTYLYPAADFFDVERTAQESFGLLGARLSAHIDSMDTDVAIWANNLANETYWASQVDFASAASLGQQVGAVGAPRTYGLTVTKNF